LCGCCDPGTDQIAGFTTLEACGATAEHDLTFTRIDENSELPPGVTYPGGPCKAFISNEFDHAGGCSGSTGGLRMVQVLYCTGTNQYSVDLYCWDPDAEEYTSMGTVNETATCTCDGPS